MKICESENSTKRFGLKTNEQGDYEITIEQGTEQFT